MNAWKVYRINDCEWWVALSLEEAIGAAMEEYRSSREEITDEDAGEVSAADMLRLRFIMDGDLEPSEGDEDDPKKSCTFAEELSRRVGAGIKAPEMFATTEI